MVDYLDNNIDIDMVYCDFDVVELDGTYKSTTKLSDPSDLRFENVVVACFLYRKQLAERIGEYDPNLFLAEDYEYWIRAYLYGNLHHIPEVLYNYGWHDESLTVTKKYQVYHKTYEAKDKHFCKLFAMCKTQEEKNRFLWGMLRLLLDDDERRAIRDKYYVIDSRFKESDKQREKANKCKSRLIKKLKTYLKLSDRR